MKKRYSKKVVVAERITVARAKELLNSRSEGQRNISEKHVRRIAALIKTGQWQGENGDTIVVDWYGELRDGQHRCEGVILAKKSIKCFIAYGIDPETYYSIDQKGRSRGLGDVLKIDNPDEINTLHTATALGYLRHYDNKTLHLKTRGGVDFTKELVDLLAANPDLRKSHSPAKKAQIVIGTGMGMFVHYIFSRISPSGADDFFEKLATGEEIPVGSAIGKLRNRLLANKLEAKAKLPSVEKVALIIKAWNSYRKGTPLGVLAWKNRPMAGGKRRGEQFPEAI